MSIVKIKRMVLITSMSLAWLLYGGMEHAPAEAALQVNEVFTAEEQHPQDLSGEDRDLKVREKGENEGLEERIFGEKLFQHTPQQRVLQSEKALRLHLKSPGKLPGIELGVEMHSLQAFQSVIPEENLPMRWDLKSEQPLLLPPSINAPDYNGGFLRFTW